MIAFGPGRVNLIGEHTDYNGGLSLPFAIEQGVRVRAVAHREEDFLVEALDLGERDRFAVHAREAVSGWRAFVRGTVAELELAGHAIVPARIEITGTVAEGSGLSSSAALEVALSLALLALGGERAPDRLDLARLCSRVENSWVGARTGLLDQLASLFGEHERALRIDFRSLEVRSVPLRAGSSRFVTVSSGETHSLAESGYNERRAECERARTLLGVESLRDAAEGDADRLPEPLDRRLLHVLGENARVDRMVAALASNDPISAGRLLDESHRSMRDLYDASTPAVERAVEALHEVGAAGARMMGGGFGGVVLGLLPEGVQPPPGSQIVVPSAGGRLLT